MNEQQLREKMDEYLSTLDDTRENEWYGTYHDFAKDEFNDFWQWLDAPEYAHSNNRVYMHHPNRGDTETLTIFVAEFASSTDAADYVAMKNGVK